MGCYLAWERGGILIINNKPGLEWRGDVSCNPPPVGKSSLSLSLSLSLRARYARTGGTPILPGSHGSLVAPMKRRPTAYVGGLESAPRYVIICVFRRSTGLLQLGRGEWGASASIGRGVPCLSSRVLR
jgi:hypothetical protein